MKKNIALLFPIIFYVIFLCCDISLAQTVNTYDSIVYDITPHFNQKILSVNAKYYGNFKHSEIIDLPYKWGSKSYLGQIKNIQIPETSSKISTNKEHNNELNIKLQKQTNLIEINYEVHLGDDNIPFDIKDGVMLPSLIHIPGHVLFAVPNNLTPEDNLKISISWHGIPKNWQVESPYGSGSMQSFISNSFDLLHSVFIIGKFRKYKVPIKDKPLRLCLYGNFDFNDQEIIQNTKKIIQSQRDFFNDYNFDNYLVTAIEPMRQDNKIASMGGIGLHNGFAMYFSKGITKTQFKTLLAHEHLHNWIGYAIQNSQEELNYWWSEGFTDYYSRVLSTKYGVLSMKELLQEVNDILGEYYNSPALNINNTIIKKEFWNNYDIYRQAYLRGFVFALSINCKIKNHTQNLSTDEILKYFYNNHKNMKFSNENFIKALKKTNTYTKEIEEHFNDTIINGKTINLKDCKFCLPVDNVQNLKQNNFYYRMKTRLNVSEKKQVVKFFNF